MKLETVYYKWDLLNCPLIHLKLQNWTSLLEFIFFMEDDSKQCAGMTHIL